LNLIHKFWFMYCFENCLMFKKVSGDSLPIVTRGFLVSDFY